MTKLNDADAIYAGTREVPKIYLGGTEIWTPPPSGVPVVFGRDAITTDTGFPGADGRALCSPYAKLTDGPIYEMGHHFRTDTIAGAMAKFFIADNVAGEPVNILIVTAAVSVPAGGGWVPFPPNMDMSAADPAGDYFLGVVTNLNDFANPGKNNDTSVTKRCEGFSFASPPSTWPGTADTYTGDLYCYATYLGAAP